MAKRENQGIQIIRGLQTLFAFVTLGLAIYTIKYYSTNTNSSAHHAVSIATTGCSMAINGVSPSKLIYFSCISPDSAFTFKMNRTDT
jgi:hypothetical protein